MGCLYSVLCPFLDCFGGDKDTTDSSSELKDVKIQKLEMEKTNISDLDQTFDDAVAPFNETIETYEAYGQAIEQFKLMTGQKKWDTIGETFLKLKGATYPNMTLAEQDGKFVLTMGDPSGDASESFGEKIIGAFEHINESSAKMGDSFNAAVESTHKIVTDAEDLKARVGDSELSQGDKALAQKSVAGNIRKCEKAPSIQAAVMEKLGGFKEELREVAKKLGESESEPEKQQEVTENGQEKKTGSNGNYSINRQRIN